MAESKADVRAFSDYAAEYQYSLKNIFSEGEIAQESVIKDSLLTASDGKKYRTQLYRLELIIAIGYRVSSHRGTQFRQWATHRLKEYIIKGFFLDDERLSKPGGVDYFDAFSYGSNFGFRSRKDC